MMMDLMILIQLIVCSIILHPTSSSSLADIDWSTFIDLNIDIDVERSINLIKSLKIRNYWDTLKAEFRTGIVGDDIHDYLPPEYLVTLDKVITSHGNKKSSVKVTNVDINLLLPHMLIVTQYLSSVSLSSDELCQIYNAITGDYNTVSRIAPVKRIYDNITSSSTILSKERVLEQIIKQKKIEKLELQIEYINKLNSKLIENEKYKLSMLKSIHDEHNSNMIRIEDEKYFKLSMINNQTLLALDSRSMKYISKKKELLDSRLNKNFQYEKERMRGEISMSLEALHFRYSEERKQMISNEPIELNLLETKHKHAMESMEIITSTLFHELYLQVEALLTQDLEAVQIYIVYFLLVLIGLLTIYETIALLPLILFKTLSKKTVFQRAERVVCNNSSGNAVTLDDLIYERNIKATLNRFIQSTSHAIKIDAPMPNAILIGDSGTGKSITSSVITAQLGIPCISICEGDLEMLGSKAGVYIRDLFDGIKSSSSSVVVLIDGADASIKSRNSRKITQVSHSFYALLQSIRINSPRVSVIITTRLPIADIDIALLDRMDYTIVLGRPSILNRLNYALLYMDEHLNQFLTTESKEILLQNIDIREYIRSTGGSSDGESEGAPPPAYVALVNLIHNLHRGQPDPENDRPGLQPPTRAESSAAAIANVRSGRRRIKANNEDSFDISSHLCDFACATEGWSYRDLNKFILSLKAAILGTEQCLLTSHIFRGELDLMAVAINRTIAGSSKSSQSSSNR